MSDFAGVEQFHQLQERPARSPVARLDHLHLSRGYASPSGKAGLCVAASLADRLKGCGGHASNAIMPATNAPVRKPTNKRAGTRPFKSGMIISIKGNGAEAPSVLGEKEILFLEAMPEPARGRIAARQVSERSPLGIAVGIEAKAAIRSAPFGGTSVFDEDAASECGKLNDHRNLLMGLGGIARFYVSLVSRFDDTLMANIVRAVNRKNARCRK